VKIATPLKGYRVDRNGKLVQDFKKLNVIERLRQKGSKRVKVVPKSKANVNRTP
jgi:hypothetical protein